MVQVQSENRIMYLNLSFIKGKMILSKDHSVNYIYKSSVNFPAIKDIKIFQTPMVFGMYVHTCLYKWPIFAIKDTKTIL